MIKANNVNGVVLYLKKNRKMQDALKIINSEICGSAWDGVVGTLYAIQVGKDEKNVRTAFKQYRVGQPVWVKKGFEKEAWESIEGNITEKKYLFDLKEKESRTALVALLSKKDSSFAIDQRKTSFPLPSAVCD